MGKVLLTYSEQLGWHAEVGLQLIWMTDATFQKQINASVAEQGISEPTLDQQIEARQFCHRLSFWDIIDDPDVRRQMFGLPHAVLHEKKGL